MTDLLLHPSAPVHSSFANAAHLMWHAGLLTGAVFHLALPVHAEVTSDDAGLGLPGVEAINNQPISKPTCGAIHDKHIKPSFGYHDSDGAWVEEYHFQKSQAPGIHVKSGVGMSHSLSKPKDNSPRIRERGDIDRVPSVSVLKF